MRSLRSDSKEYWRQYRLANKERLNAQARARRKANPNRARINKLKQKYGLSETQHKAILALPCAICVGRVTDVDHDHKTGRVRGGLCRPCNLGLGMFRDDPALLDAAKEYLAHEGVA